MIPYNNVHMYALGTQIIIMRMHALGRKILIDPRNNVHMYVRTYLLGIIDPMQIIMYICTCTHLVENPQIIMYICTCTHLVENPQIIMYIRMLHTYHIRTYLLGIIDPR